MLLNEGDKMKYVVILGDGMADWPIEKIGNNKLPYHSAFKKATYLNENGEVIKPSEPNAYKFESFIFDAFNKLDDMLIFRVKREEEFAPVKNKEGVDSVETAVQLYNKFYEKNSNI